MPGYANPQNLNRYSYVTNNPLRYTDPTGHRACEGDQGYCLSENQATKKYKFDLQQRKNKSKNRLEKIALEQPVDIFVPVSDSGGPDIFTAISNSGGINIFVPVSGDNGLDIFVPVPGGNVIDINVPINPEDEWDVLTETPEDILMPGGTPIGTQQGRDERIRTVRDKEELQQIFDALTADGTPVTSSRYEGIIYQLPGGGTVGRRDSVKHGPTLDINIPGIPIDKLHLPT